MSNSNDNILSELVRKKKSLLDDLLVLSIKSVYEASPTVGDTQRRSDILSMLEKNDEAIKIRELQTGIKATGQESALFSDIATLLSSIQANNRAVLVKLEIAEKEFETERSKLGKGKKLSSYVSQINTISRFRQKNKKDDINSRQIRGIL